MVEGSKQVRVDNWGVFFLQRLQMFFSKTDYCDLTLQFEGNVQLKVHRLVMNACTEYFTILEQNYPAMEENTIMMPGDLQSDVIVPIVNFMYTGMLEFHMSIFEKLYTAAELMNISILTKLLDAQRTAYQQHKLKQRSGEPKLPKPERKPLQKEKAPSFSNDFPPPTPGRKVHVWKRKAVPASHPVSQLHFPEHRFPMDPLSILDNTPKPTRFEWPEDDLPAPSFMDGSFEDITLTSRPLLTKEEEDKAKPSFDDLKYNVEMPKKTGGGGSKASSSLVNTAEVEEFVKEQKIRIAMFEDVESVDGGGQKRKTDPPTSKQPPKKMKVTNKENLETTISVESSDIADMDKLDHTKIVSQILKKYPDLVKKNKNIKFKIMTSGNNKSSPEKLVENSKKQPIQECIKKNPRSQTEPANKPAPPPKPVAAAPKSLNPAAAAAAAARHHKRRPPPPDEGPWVCRKCEEFQEFVLYYLYRKHVTDVHGEIFDADLCKYCGKRCPSDTLMMYHLYTKHALKPPAGQEFPQCDKCPYIAQSSARLNRHKTLHRADEMQCQDCKLAFAGPQALRAHVRLTGHYNKPGKAYFDCQYCMKKLQSAVNLFAHIEHSHPREGRRDGIVCLDELDSMEGLEDVEEEEEKAKAGEAVKEENAKGPSSGAVVLKDKVKIISNVKVPPNRQKPAESNNSSSNRTQPSSSANHQRQQRVIQLDPSSEAESLNNVASGIATSLGLVDIVVLDDRHQQYRPYILQQDDSQGGQEEFILPELGSGQSFTGQVITTTQHNTVLQQGMIQSAGSDIGSTDELVMVLTDHEYQDEQEGENSDNSNIVVLYSHPIEGQQGQFITSQGNLLVNSQTGMLEIRNGANMTSPAADQQVAVTSDADAPVESIEMIHREIHGTDSVMKQEPYYEQEAEEEEEREEPGVASESTAEAREEEYNAESPNENSPEHEEPPAEGNEDDVDGGNEEESMEIDEESPAKDVIEEQGEEGVGVAPKGKVGVGVATEEGEGMDVASEEEEGVDVAPDREEGVDVVPDREEGVDVAPEVEEGVDDAPERQSEKVIVNDLGNLPEQEDSCSEDEEEQGESENAEERKSDDQGVEPMEVDGKVGEEGKVEDRGEMLELRVVEEMGVREVIEEVKVEAEGGEEKNVEIEGEEERNFEGEEEGNVEVDEERNVEVDEERNVEVDEERNVEEEEDEEKKDISVVESPTVSEEPHSTTAQSAAEERPDEPDTSECATTEETPALTEESGDAEPKGVSSVEEEKKRKNLVDINKTILDDWEEEDTDYPHTIDEEKISQVEAENKTRAVDNVNTLMDDWEEEDEEEKKEVV